MPDVFLSIACGIITGMAIYILANYRNKLYSEMSIEYKSLLKLRNQILQWKKEIKFFQNHNIPWGDDESVDDFVYRIAYSKYDMDNIIEEFPERLFFDKLNYEDEYPLTDLRQSIVEKLCQSYIDYGNQETVSRIMNMVGEDYDHILAWIKPVYGDLEGKLSIMNKSVF